MVQLRSTAAAAAAMRRRTARMAVVVTAMAALAAGCATFDDAIFAAKCAGAADTKACEAQARKDYEDYQRKKKQETDAASAASRARAEPSDTCWTDACRANKAFREMRGLEH